MRAHLLLSALLFATLFSGFSYVALILGRAGLKGDGITIALLGFGAAGLAGNWLSTRLSRRPLPATQAVALTVAAAVAALSIANMAGPAAIGAAVLVWGVAHSVGFVLSQVRLMAAMPEAPSLAGSLNISAANIGIALGSFAGGQALELGGFEGLAFATLLLALLSAAAAHRLARRGAGDPCQVSTSSP